MNKISKKILAIVTMVAFVVTMMPFAAFAAESFSVTQSNVKISKVAGVEATQPITAEAVKDQIELTFEINDKSGAPFAGDTGVAKDDIQVWVEDEDGNYQDALDVVDGLDTEDGNIQGDFTAVVTIARDGVYTIHAGIGADVEEASKAGNEFAVSGDATKVEVYADSETVQSIGIANATTAGGVVSNDGEGADENLTNGESATLKYASFDNIPANGIAKDTITGYAYSGTTGEDKVIGATFDVTVAGGNGMTVDKTQVTTDRNGKFELKISFTKAADYKIVLSNDDIKVTLNVERAEVAKAQDIVTTVNNGQTLLAGTDADCNATDVNYFAKAVQFEITDKDGKLMSEDLNEPAFTATANNLYLTVEDKPVQSKLTAADLKLDWNEKNDVYTLVYVDGSNKAIDLVPGEYTVKVALKSGESAEATFTVAKFGEVTGMEIDVADTIVYNDADGIEGTVNYVDENGIVKPADESVTIGYSGAACQSLTPDSPDFTVIAKDDDKYVGAKITVTAVDDSYGVIATKDITVTDGVTEGTLEFDPTTGAANENNTVNVSVVDEDGNVIKVEGDMVAYVAEQSNADAIVDIDTKDVSEGKGKLTVYSDKEGTVDVVVAVTTTDENNQHQIFANTLTYTFGEADINADTTVAMTIGSSDIIVNNDIVSGDAAPYVDSNWRTMVPLRALTEAFGGTAEWDGDARTVTVENGDTTIVFDADSNKYTVNDTEKEMDTNLVINDGRTYVPVRFVAEELGYQITVLKDAQGLTAGVVFQK